MPHLVGQELLVDLPVVHLLLDGAGGDEPVNCDVPLLPDAPRALPRLRIQTKGRASVPQLHL